MISKQPLLKTICAGLLVFVFVLAPVTLNTNERQVSFNETKAFLGGGDPATIWLVFKEEILDMIVWELINLVLEELVKSMTDWVRSGFRDGGPAFVDDFAGFMGETANEATSLFIDGTPLEDLCTPFAFQVRGGLDLFYNNTTRYKASCTLSDIVDNMEAFVDGDFYAGGWDGFAAMAFNEQNNIYGATFQAQAGLDAAIRTRTGEELAYLNFGSGFYGQEQCNEDGECFRVTPGETVNESLNNALNIGNNRLELADEFNELFGALLSQLMKNVLGAGGLKGFDGRGVIEEEKTPGVPTSEEARGINDYANEVGRQNISEQQEGIGILANAAEYCRNAFNRPLSGDLMQAGYSMAWNQGGEPIDQADLQERVDEYIANDCEELP